MSLRSCPDSVMGNWIASPADRTSRKGRQSCSAEFYRRLLWSVDPDEKCRMDELVETYEVHWVYFINH